MQGNFLMRNKKIKKAVVVHQGALGDLVCTLPGLSALRARSELMVGVGSPRLKLLEYAGILDKAVSSESTGFHQLFLEKFEPGPYLRPLFQDAELVVSWLGKGSELYKRNLGSLAARVFVFEKSFHQSKDSSHICRILADPVLAAGVEIDDYSPCLKLPEQPEPDRSLPVSGGPFIAVHPGSGSIKKALPPDKFFRVLGRVKEIHPDEKLVIIAGDADKTLLMELIKRMPVELRASIQIVENADLATLAWVLKKARLFLGTDSGPGHLAAALGTKTLVLFGPTDPKIWAPPQPWVKFVAADYACAPCPAEQRRDCEDAKCLAAIDEDQIIKSLRELENIG
jgi:heptosyltransferase III